MVEVGGYDKRFFRPSRQGLQARLTGWGGWWFGLGWGEGGCMIWEMIIINGWCEPHHPQSRMMGLSTFYGWGWQGVC